MFLCSQPSTIIWLVQSSLLPVTSRKPGGITQEQISVQISGNQYQQYKCIIVNIINQKRTIFYFIKWRNDFLQTISSSLSNFLTDVQKDLLFFLKIWTAKNKRRPCNITFFLFSRKTNQEMGEMQGKQNQWQYQYRGGWIF